MAEWGGRLLVAVLAAVWVLMPLLSVSSARAQSEAGVPRFEQAACPFAAPSGMPEGGTVRCGYLVVPEQRARGAEANGQIVRLAVALVSRGRPRAAEPVVYLAGGPGEAGSTDLAPLLGGPLRTLLEDHDWIFLDQRGTGFSEPSLACNGVNLSGRVEVQNILDCVATLSEAGVDLPAYSTFASASDVADLIRTLGYDQVNLYGASYGTRLALAVVHDSPELVRAVILDGVFPPQASGYADAPISVTRSLRLVFEACAADMACHARYPNPLGQLGHLLTTLHAQPVGLHYTDPTTHQQRHAMLDHQLFLQIVDVLLYAREGLELLPALIGITDGGDFGPVASFLPDLDAYGSPISAGMYYSIECAEDAPRVDSITLSQRDELPGVREGLGLGDDLLQACAAWPVPPAEARASDAVVSDVPTLLLAGRFDPITPPEYAVQAAVTLAHSYAVEFATGSHVSLSSGSCSIGIARQFLAAPDHAPETHCASEGTLTFVLP